MAKRRGRGGSASTDKEAVEITSADLRRMAADLKRLATKLESRAGDMDALRVKSFHMFMANWNNARKFQRGWLAKQLLPRLMAAADDLGIEIDIALDNFDPENPPNAD